jgi:hypothetical protein
MDGKQLKILFHEYLYNILKEKAEKAGVTMASLVRLAVSEVYGKPDGTEEYLGVIKPNLDKVPRYSESEKVVELGFLETYQEADEND